MMMMMMMIKDRRDIKPILVKFGVALALSFAGFLYSRIRIKRINPSDPPSPPVSDSDKKADSEGRLKVNDDLQMDAVDEEEKPCIRVRVDSSAMHTSPNGRYNGDRDAFLLPEFDQVVKEFDAVNSSKIDEERFTVNKDLPKSLRRVERDDYEQEIKNLQKRIKFLVERERKLEVQLLEYYGLKEQETVMMELKNRLKINNIETKLFLMKIENLQAENKRLKDQVADYSKVVSELEDARAKIKLLKRKIRSEAEQNREQILDLTQRVVNFQEHEHEHEASTSVSDDQSEVQRLGELEVEAEELRKCNENLQRENADLAQRLESTQILATSLFEDPDKEELHKEMIRLRDENEKLTNEVERLQVDKCGEVEELVYLRWINACLRYELRNYQPPPGKTVARDLSKCLSPTSEKKAKLLILEYANSEDGANQELPSLADFDFDHWPSSQPSYLTDSTDHDESSGPSSVHKTHNKTVKFFSKLRKLVRGISNHHHHHNHNQRNQTSPMSRSFSVDEIGTKYYEAGHNCSRSNPQSPRLASSSQNSNNSSLEYQPLTSLAEEEENGSRMRSKSLSGVSHVLGRERPGGFLSLDCTPARESEYGQKSDLTKYAEVFRDSSLLQKHKRSASYSIG